MPAPRGWYGHEQRPKLCHRAGSLRSLFKECGSELATICSSEYCLVKELVIVWAYRENEPVMYGFDALGPYKRRWEQGFFHRKKRIVKRRVSVEELLSAYPGNDPDEMINLFRNFVADTIAAIERACLNRQNSNVLVSRRG
ncbi:MAG: hypothetical protein KBA91_00360 [Candidatus Moranbacteria bacterium]|nr:hypothetical protein [Candidatus Moranbacteria bacterium]